MVQSYQLFGGIPPCPQHGRRMTRCRFGGQRLRPPRLAGDLAGALGNEARRALIAGMNPEPAQGDPKAVAQADQEVDVGDAPDPPCDGSAQLDPAEIDHRLAFADLGEAAGMAVAKWSRCLACEPRLDRGCDVIAL